jgi:hypothetical protein
LKKTRLNVVSHDRGMQPVVSQLRRRYNVLHPVFGMHAPPPWSDLMRAFAEWFAARRQCSAACNFS